MLHPSLNLVLFMPTLVPSPEQDSGQGAWDNELPRFGRSVCVMGDLDGDGIEEFAVGASRAGNSVAKDTGAILLFSGAERRVVQVIYGPRGGLRLGKNLWLTEDRDGDDLADLLVEGESGAIASISTSSGKVLWLHEPQEHLLFHCSMVAGLLDADADGVKDHLLMASKGTYFLSGSTGQRIEDAGTSKWWPIGDLDGDGEPEQLLPDEGKLMGGSHRWMRSLRDVGDRCQWQPRAAIDWNRDGATDWIVGLSVISGIDGSLLHTWNGNRLPGKDPTIGASFGYSLVVPGDLNEDGVTDVVIGSPGIFFSAVAAYSGENPNELLWIVKETSGLERYGTSMDALKDVDGDGVVDLLVGGTDHNPGSAVAPGSVWIISGRTGRVVWTLRAKELDGLKGR